MEQRSDMHGLVFFAGIFHRCLALCSRSSFARVTYAMLAVEDRAHYGKGYTTVCCCYDNLVYRRMKRYETLISQIPGFQVPAGASPLQADGRPASRYPRPPIEK